MTASVTKTVDSRGRVTLGKDFANQLVIVQEVSEGYLRIVRAEAVPAKEAWLYKNPEALAAVMRGLEQAKARRFAERPNLEADAALADAIDE